MSFRKTVNLYISVFTRPTSLTINNATESSISLSWTEPKGGNAFALKHYLVFGFDCDNRQPQDENVSIEGLTPSTMYLITIAAVGSDNRTGTESECLEAVTGSLFNSIVSNTKLIEIMVIYRSS